MREGPCDASKAWFAAFSFPTPSRLWADDSGSATKARAAVVACSGRDASLSLCREVAVSEINAQTLTIVQISSPSIRQGHCSFLCPYFFYCLVCFFFQGCFFVSMCYYIGCMYIATCNARHSRPKWGTMASFSARLVPVIWKGVWSTPRTEGKDASSEGKKD